MQCCRTCLGTDSLLPIFVNPLNNKKYSDMLLTCTGLRIEQNDSLPQVICSKCVNIINKHNKFRNMCQKSQKSLVGNCDIDKSTDNSNDKMRNCNDMMIISVDINDIDDCVDNDDDKTINNDSVDNTNTDNKNTDCQEFEMSIKEVLDKKMDVKFDNFKVFKKKQLNYTEIKVKELKRVEKIEDSKCELCHKVFESKVALNNHFKTHSGLNVVCEHCGKKFINRRRLLMHCKAKHGYEKTDKCSYCDYRGCNAELVKIHERLHTGERPYVCGVCGACFHRRSSFLQHRPIHLPDKTVQCDECPALFKSVTLMHIHKHRHKRRAGIHRVAVRAALERA